MHEALPVVHMRPGKEEMLGRFHPWVFSGALDKIPPQLTPGSRVELRSAKGKPLAIGHYLGGSIAIKIVSFATQVSVPDVLSGAIQLAIARRKTLGLWSDPATTGFRLIHGEGDFLPGLIVDLFGDTAVVQLHSPGMAQELDVLAEAIQRHAGDRVNHLFVKPVAKQGHAEEGEDEQGGRYIFGGGGEPEIREHGLRFGVDWVAGQKTGFFLDQRENRRFLREHAAGRRVLNLFSYSGAFSIAALAGGAAEAVSVDSSGAALKLAEENAARNGLSNRHRTVEADCFDYLQTAKDDFDLIVVDPPAFAKCRNAIRGGERGYTTLNLLALRATPPGGMVLTFSCSQLVSPARFRELIFEAAVKSRREVAVVATLHQAPCHPINVFCPESEYLKGLVLLVN